MTKLRIIPLALLLLVSSLACGGESDEEIAESIAGIPSAYHVSSVQLLSEYDASQKDADEKYKGQVVTIEGTITEIGVDSFGNPFLVLEGVASAGVRCLFTVQEVQEFVTLSKGQTVTVRGRLEGRAVNVLVRGCTLP